MLARAGRCATPTRCRRDRDAHHGHQARQAEWRARKIRELLVRSLDGEFRVPAKSTINAFLCRHGLVKSVGRVRRRAQGTPLWGGSAPSALWCVNFEGEFKLADGRRCYPLTVTDHARRFLMLCEALDRRGRTLRSPPSNSSFASAACLTPSPPTTAFPSPVPTASSPLEAFRVVAAARRHHRAPQARPSEQERPAGAHAPDLRKQTPARRA